MPCTIVKLVDQVEGAFLKERSNKHEKNHNDFKLLLVPDFFICSRPKRSFELGYPDKCCAEFHHDSN